MSSSRGSYTFLKGYTSHECSKSSVFGNGASLRFTGADENMAETCLGVHCGVSCLISIRSSSLLLYVLGVGGVRVSELDWMVQTLSLTLLCL